MREESKATGRRNQLVVALCAVACGCSGIGTSKFYEDQLGYSRALGEGEKSSTLLNVVRIRYGDTPTFLQPTQVISGYQLQRSVTGGLEVFPAANPSTFLSGGASAQLQESPTFTFQPLSGEQFARSFVRPLSSSDLLPLAMSGMPIDVLFRLGVQSVNAYSNAVALTDTGAAGSPEFFQLLYDLRRLQVVGLLNVRLSPTRASEGVENVSSTGHPDASAPADHSDGFRGAAGFPPYVYLTFTPTPDLALTKVADEAKLLMNVAPQATEAEVIYGRTAGPGQVAMITRSVLGVMSQLAIQIAVPAEDIARHRTLPTVGNVGLERRPRRDYPLRTLEATDGVHVRAVRREYVLDRQRRLRQQACVHGAAGPAGARPKRKRARCARLGPRPLRAVAGTPRRRSERVRPSRIRRSCGVATWSTGPAG